MTIFLNMARASFSSLTRFAMMLKFFLARLARERLDDRVGIGEARGVGGHDDEDVLADGVEIDDVRGEARGRVHEEEIVIGQLPEGGKENLPLLHA